jgi:hypothetical protein
MRKSSQAGETMSLFLLEGLSHSHLKLVTEPTAQAQGSLLTCPDPGVFLGAMKRLVDCDVYAHC